MPIQTLILLIYASRDQSGRVGKQPAATPQLSPDDASSFKRWQERLYEIMGGHQF
jgi:hypothetical protein